jgi:hypothetical protein
LSVGTTSRFGILVALLFLATGVFWLLIVLLGQGDVLLIWPSIASLVSGGLIFAKRNVEITRSIALAAALYNLLVFLYQAYSALTLIGSSFGSFAILAAAGYLLGTVLFILVMLGLYADSGVLGLVSSRFVEDSKMNIRS